MDLKAPLVLKAPEVAMAKRATLDHLDHLERLVRLEKTDKWDHLGPGVRMEIMEVQEVLDHQEVLELPVSRVFLAKLAPGASQGPKEILDHEVNLLNLTLFLLTFSLASKRSL